MMWGHAQGMHRCQKLAPSYNVCSKTSRNVMLYCGMRHVACFRPVIRQIMTQQWEKLILHCYDLL